MGRAQIYINSGTRMRSNGVRMS
uniref:Uncharacterized protein n=1 Tax=Arundo donax TaxID=35708 RepID=A0A0A9ANE9_ARUDO